VSATTEVGAAGVMRAAKEAAAPTDAPVTARGMVEVPASQVQLGSSEQHLDDVGASQHYKREWFEDEAPQHYANVDGFWIDAHLVTNGDYLRFCEATGYRTEAEQRGFGLIYGSTYWDEVDGVCWRHPGAPDDTIEDRLDHPVVHIAYADAAAYAAWVGKRLPTEAEWEYAAHGPQWRCWPWGEEWDYRIVNCAEHWYGSPITEFKAWHAWWGNHLKTQGTRLCTTPVGRFSPASDSPFGVSDMAGNVSEWTGSVYELYDPARRYHETYERAAGRYRVIRGGSWMNFKYQMRTSERFASDPAYSSISIGFRCASSAEPTT
jgi:formylglycine-generating enzyme